MSNKLNTIISFIDKIFIHKTSIPIISITLFILVIILNSIQYSKNNKKYLQNQIIVSNQLYSNGTVRLENALLFLYDIVGINGFLNNSLLHILYLILTYSLLSLIEMNIGYLALIFLLFITIMFRTFWDEFQDAICKNKISMMYGIESSSYCCGSVILFMSLGFVLIILLKNINTSLYKIIILCIIICIYFVIMIVEKNTIYSHIQNKNIKQCQSYTWHAAMYVFGIVCGLQLSF